jgi:hypothetical protein
VIGVADLAPFQRVVAHVERDALLLQTVDLRGHVHVGISVLHVPRFLEVFGLQEKRQSVAVENDLEVQVVLADGVDVILDVAQCAGLGFRVVIVDVVDDLLLAVAFAGAHVAGLPGDDAASEQGGDGEMQQFSHCVPPSEHCLDRLLGLAGAPEWCPIR